MVVAPDKTKSHSHHLLLQYTTRPSCTIISSVNLGCENALVMSIFLKENMSEKQRE